MKRGTKEFYDMVSSFEKSVKNGDMGYAPSDLTKDNFNISTFYSNGQVNQLFLAFMRGYAAAKCEYQ